MAMAGKIPEPRVVQVADGLWAQAIQRVDLPPHLDVEQHRGLHLPCACRPLLTVLQVTRQSNVQVRGARQACAEGEHATEHWLSGTYNGMDLTLLVCQFCWRVEVRNRSFDILVDSAPDGRTLRLTPQGRARRKDDLLGWYSGRRPAGRTHL